MINKRTVLAFLLGWVVLGWVYPPQRLAAMFKRS